MVSIDRLKEMALEDIEKNPEKHLEEYVELLQQLDQLKTENEELEKWKKEHLKDVEFIERNPVIDILNSRADNILLEQRNEKIKQTLTDIKEIAEKEVNNRMLFADKESFCDFNKILQKISEVEDG